MSFCPMKVKAVVLTAGLIALGANAAWSALPTCKSPEKNYKVRNSGDHCTSKSYKFNKNSKCTCPGYPSNATKKCWLSAQEHELQTNHDIVYSCEVP